LCYNHQIIYRKKFTNKKVFYFWNIPLDYPINKFLKFCQLNFKKFYE
jgi:hypothetical protein